MENISYWELSLCETYADEVIEWYKAHNNGELPMTASDAEAAVYECLGDMEEYTEVIVQEIGFIVEGEEA